MKYSSKVCLLILTNLNFSLVWCGVHWQSQHCQLCCSHSWSHSPGAIFWSADCIKFFSLLEGKPFGSHCKNIVETSDIVWPPRSIGALEKLPEHHSNLRRTFLCCPFLDPVETLVERLNCNLSANLLFSWLALFPVNSNSSTWPEAFDFISCLQQQKFSHPVSTLFKARESSKENPPTPLDQR